MVRPFRRRDPRDEAPRAPPPPEVPGCFVIGRIDNTRTWDERNPRSPDGPRRQTPGSLDGQAPALLVQRASGTTPEGSSPAPNPDLVLSGTTGVVLAEQAVGDIGPAPCDGHVATIGGVRREIA